MYRIQNDDDVKYVILISCAEIRLCFFVDWNRNWETNGVKNIVLEWT